MGVMRRTENENGSRIKRIQALENLNYRKRIIVRMYSRMSRIQALENLYYRKLIKIRTFSKKSEE